MTTDVAPGRVAAYRFERLLYRLVAVFGLIFALLTTYYFLIGLPTTPGPLGALFVALILAAVVVGGAAALLPGAAMLLFRFAFASYAFGLAVWPFALESPLPPSQLAWVAALWPMMAVYLAASHRRVHRPILLSAAVAAVVTLVLARIDGAGPVDLTIHFLFIVGSTAVVSVLLGAVRQAIDVAEYAQDVAVDRFVEAKRDDAEEVERVRTDALVHDCVLTTLLSAGSAVTQDEEDLSRRMAANALRVLGHVNRSAEQGPAVPFGHVLARLGAEEAPIVARFELQSVGTDDLMLPAHVADALLAAMVAVMRESVESGVPRTVRTRMLGPDGIRIVVKDGGPEANARVRDEVAQRMRSIDGRAEVGVLSGGGTTVTLSWGSVVITGTAPLAGELLVVA